MEVLDLFAGIGGFAIAAKEIGFEIAQFVENNPHKQKVLSQFFPDIPIHSDIEDFIFPPNFDGIITAGFPTGASHPNLWRHIIRGIIQCSPRFVVIEQPLDFLNRGLRGYCGAVKMAGYQSRIICISAGELGAGHRRGRVFVISHPNSGGCNESIAVIPRTDEVRGLVQSRRSNSLWLKIATGDDESDNGLSVELAEGNLRLRLEPSDLFCPPGLRGRINARIAAGQAVTPAQASIPLTFIRDYLL